MAIGTNEMVLVYLLMASDGTVSDDELLRFDELLAHYELQSKKNAIIGSAKDVVDSVEVPKDSDKYPHTLYEAWKQLANTQGESKKNADFGDMVDSATILAYGLSISKHFKRMRENKATITDEVQEEKLSIPKSFSRMRENKATLWTLINMAFADGECSGAEKIFIARFSTDMNIDWDIAEEMMDIAKAMYAVQKQLDWLKSDVKKPYGEIETFVQELNKNQSVLEEQLGELGVA